MLRKVVLYDFALCCYLTAFIYYFALPCTIWTSVVSGMTIRIYSLMFRWYITRLKQPPQEPVCELSVIFLPYLVSSAQPT